ncbi:hypothetical protein C1I98_17540 [Spongiactinospora gelatinilytica]|uniref:Uncharacterized protein n=1 Tax=Spongiactinospora gelatinilytica TaxID=2666298 RepID=A0A2W2I040_9ACTN|nr:lysylphosphatidylglycerol synthase domain-containing protein [Spongiactinospora gelatinilytica]PZG44204.1 hypothetical protein C1I98_17540 [Spongiactinospora gelatinilytica]
MKRRWLQVLLSLASLGLAAALVAYLPQIVETFTGTRLTWAQIGAEFAGVSWPAIALMTLTWLASLAGIAGVLCASLPGLSLLQGVTLNAAGSAVSNVLPFGGALGIGVTFAMTRGWGFPPGPVTVSVLVSGIWNTLFRFALPAVGIVALLVSGKRLDAAIVNAGWIGAAAIFGLVAVSATALYSDRAGRIIGRALDGLARLTPWRHRLGHGGISAAVERLRAGTGRLVRGRWPALSLSMIAFLVLQWLILVECLHATGSYPGLAESIAVFALSRVLQTAVITPSGTGIMEAGVAAALLFFQMPAGGAAAAAILFGFWTYTIEIPFGGLALGAWALLRRRDDRRAARAAQSAEPQAGGRPTSAL